MKIIHESAQKERKLVAVINTIGGIWLANNSGEGTTHINRDGKASRGIVDSLENYSRDPDRIMVYEGDTITLEF